MLEVQYMESLGNDFVVIDGVTQFFEPSSKEILDLLLKRYIETQIYQAVIENNACEQAAKMIAMKNAPENAEEIIKELQLLYNNARQASITQELSEIVGGAAAI